MRKSRPGTTRGGSSLKLWKVQAPLMLMIFSWPLFSLSGPHLYSERTFLSKPSRTSSNLTVQARSGVKDHRQNRGVFHKPSNPKWTWPLSLMILTFSLSASSVQTSSRFCRRWSNKQSTKLQAFAGGLEGCDYHGAGRYEFDPSLECWSVSFVCVCVESTEESRSSQEYQSCWNEGCD